MRTTYFLGMLTLVLISSTLRARSQDTPSQDHAVSGVVKSVDPLTKTVVVKSADGAEFIIKYNDKTLVKHGTENAKGTKPVTADAAITNEVGSHVTLKYGERGPDKIALTIQPSPQQVSAPDTSA
jgi:hypothetical protein